MCAVVGLFVSVIVWVGTRDAPDQGIELFGGVAAFILGAASLIAGLIGIVRFLKWVWDG